MNIENSLAMATKTAEHFQQEVLRVIQTLKRVGAPPSTMERPLTIVAQIEGLAAERDALRARVSQAGQCFAALEKWLITGRHLVRWWDNINLSPEELELAKASVERFREANPGFLEALSVPSSVAAPHQEE